MRSLIRGFLVCAVATLLLGAALAPRLRADGARDTGPLWASYPTCTLPFVDTGWDTTIALLPYPVIAQRFTYPGNIAACSLKVSSSYTFGRVDLVQWDAATLQPDPTTVALRSVTLTSSNMAWNWLHIPMSPPLVTTALAHVADPPSAPGALVYTGTYPFNQTVFRYTRDGAPTLPVGLWRTGSEWQTLPGPHGVHGISLCGGDALLQDLRVVQSVMGTDGMLPRVTYEALQRFRVPRAVRAHWVEVALDSAVADYYRIGEISVLRDGIGATPPAEMPLPLVAASLWPQGPLPAWVSHFDFDSSLTLLPGVDYWLRVTSGHYYAMRTHALTGGESADFTSAIGPLWMRYENGYNWLPVAGRALSFRVIGDTAVNLVGVEPGPRRSPLELRATPNPARGASVLAWSGAVGRVTLEVLDARGRRVADDAIVTGASGRYTWTASRSGRPLPAGLYFVRATDAEGHAALARVVLIR